jgi:hypothetical protein
MPDVKVEKNESSEEVVPNIPELGVAFKSITTLILYLIIMSGVYERNIRSTFTGSNAAVQPRTNNVQTFTNAIESQESLTIQQQIAIINRHTTAYENAMHFYRADNFEMALGLIDMNIHEEEWKLVPLEVVSFAIDLGREMGDPRSLEVAEKFERMYESQAGIPYGVEA